MKYILIIVMAWLFLPLAVRATESLAKQGSRSQTQPSQQPVKPGLTKPFLWRVENPRGKACYAFGSIHLADKRVVAGWSKTLKDIFRNADAVYFEIPFDQETLAKVDQVMRTPGNSLAKLLPTDLYSRTEAKLKQIAPTMKLELFDELKPVAFGVKLFALEIAQQGPVPMDFLLYKQMANIPGKTVGGLESVEEQAAAFYCLTPSEDIEVLRASLDYMDACKQRGTSAFDEINNAYLSGDLEKLMATMNSSMMSGVPETTIRKFNDALLTNRNRRLAERMAKKMKEHQNQTQVFVLGAAHYAEPHGVLDLLRQDGFKISRVTEFQ
jgi:uncharacterized protein YbaP (TraB family)